MVGLQVLGQTRVLQLEVRGEMEQVAPAVALVVLLEMPEVLLLLVLVRVVVEAEAHLPEGMDPWTHVLPQLLAQAVVGEEVAH